MAPHGAAELAAMFEANGLPFAPIAKPHELFDDPHLNASGGLAPVLMNDGTESKVPLLPLAFDGHRLGLRLQPPQAGEHTHALLRELGYDEAAIAQLLQAGTAASAA